MGFLKSIFGGDKQPPSPRSITSPKDLTLGDMLKMEFASQRLISGQTLKVTEQIFYDLSAVEKCKAVCAMDGVDKRVYVSQSTVNPEKTLEVAINVLPETIFRLFKEKEFVAIFDEPDNTDHRLNLINTIDEVDGFVGQSYYQERTNEAYRSTRDCREATLSETDWAGFDYKLMVSDDRQHAIRIEIFDGGRTDVFLIAYLALNKVEEYWPA
ncbi:hypothetical protein MNBD_GAMMA06-2062 [hydrothermal vent metagenome]|uniref:Uncharacterized protein n=1 Tax=hydrothermal vent metagenome TaxID=652676 RepID=A0A3B0W7H7_9ZZZZ